MPAMLFCERCKVQLPGTPKRCALCRGAPTGEGDPVENVFPVIPPSASPYRSLYAWAAFGSVAAGVVCVILNIIIPAGGWWSLFVLGGMVTLWVSVLLIERKRKNVPRYIFWRVLVVSAMAVVWDVFTGFRGWSVNYVIPILSTCSLIAMAVVARRSRLPISDYIGYFIVAALFGLVSALIIMADAVTVVIPSAICLAVSILSLTALMIFEGKALWAELRRRFHL